MFVFDGLKNCLLQNSGILFEIFYEPQKIHEVKNTSHGITSQHLLERAKNFSGLFDS